LRAGFGVWALGFGLWGLAVGGWALGFGLWAAWLRISFLGFRVQGAGEG